MPPITRVLSTCTCIQSPAHYKGHSLHWVIGWYYGYLLCDFSFCPWTIGFTFTTPAELISHGTLDCVLTSDASDTVRLFQFIHRVLYFSHRFIYLTISSLLVQHNKHNRRLPASSWSSSLVIFAPRSSQTNVLNFVQPSSGGYNRDHLLSSKGRHLPL